MWNSQAELEEQMVLGGRERARRVMERNEEGGRAAHNPYAKTIFKRFVEPLSELIKQDMNATGAGKRKGYVKFLRALEPETTAYIAVRTVLTMLLEEQSIGNGRKVFYSVGKSVQSEQILRQYATMDQEGFYKLQKELKRRQSQNLRHRMTLATMGMRSQDIQPIDWGQGARDQVGAYLVDKLRELDMIEVNACTQAVKGKTKHLWTVSLTDAMIELISQIREMVEETMPYFMPCIEQPKDWVSVHDGGFHTPAMQKMASSAILNGNAGRGDTREILQAMNILQRVKYQINNRVLDVAKEIAKITETEEIVSTNDPDKPERPEFLETVEKKDMTEEQKIIFKRWKRDMAEYHTQIRLRSQAYGRMFNVFRISDKFKDEKELFFVYHADFRGRFYPYTTGPNPQGSDLQRAVLQFSDGKPLRTQESIDWFIIHGANAYGVDKAPFAERIKWVHDNQQMILAIADDPIANIKQWAIKGSASKPFQFLAWAFEYADFVRYERAFVSHIAISMDGSCNGLQNFSAALRDKVGGDATNLIPSDKPKDIYSMVARVTMDKLNQMPEDENQFRSRWLMHGINRSLVKRSVMTLPYGSTRFSCRDFILNDYIKVEEPIEFQKDEYKKAASFLANVVWSSIGDVVIKAREAMEWLQKCSTVIMETKRKDIQWTTPTGFVVSQQYYEIEDTARINVQIYGGSRLLLSGRTDKPDKRRHRNGIAPNFIHSLDAAHMQRVAIRCKQEGIHSLAMIHDDFGTLAADAPRFNQIIREEFVKMYQQDDWLARFAQSYIDAGVKLPLPPSHGTLDITQVLDSKYFFA